MVSPELAQWETHGIQILEALGGFYALFHVDAFTGQQDIPDLEVVAGKNARDSSTDHH